jgi:proteasome accessory factor C
MSATADVARMLTLVPWFLERPGASLDEAADAFGVSASVIRRDLGHLDFCGLPGLGGGALFDVSLVGDRVVVSMADELRRPLRPTASEGLRLVLTVDAVMGALGEELPALRTGIDKVRAALGIPEDVADVLDADEAPGIEVARAALRDGARLRLTYQGRSDTQPTLREVDPWSLHIQDGVWYLQGHDHGVGERRTFRLDRTAGIEALAEPVSVAAPDHLPAPRYAPAPDDLEVTIEVDPAGRWLEGAVVVDAREDREDGGAVLTLRTDAPRWIARLVLMAGGAARVVAPDALRAEVLRLATDS